MKHILSSALRVALLLPAAGGFAAARADLFQGNEAKTRRFGGCDDEGAFAGAG